MRSAEFGDIESIAEADNRHHFEKVAVLQMSEIATAPLPKYQLLNMYF